ncbi:cuticle protein-like [Ostrinia furnacalis]|uniref:cuticle protein-like n=1 Tax=Ostrinia furnacalis TaxID=93504 RepID=UPI00103D7418|nr:cuticle protein-like [Ostrinia furnacalis]
MAAKFFVVLSLAVAASAVPLVPVAKVAYAEVEAPAHYEFQYSVHDEHSGDIKQQQEARAGDAVHGSYSLLQPDGLTRVVDYSADKEHGFNAVVRYEGHPAPAPAHPVKLAYAAPVAKVAYAAPVAKVAYAAPVAKVAYAAPVAKVAYAAPVAKRYIVLCSAAAAVAVPAVPLAKLAYAEPEQPAQYEYSYTVEDQHSGDIKQQKENRNGDAVHGYYSLIQPDGTQRIVEYTADKEHGFNAVVRYEGHPTVAPAHVAKVAYAAPVAKVAYAAPVSKVAYAQAPVSYAAPAHVSYAAAPAQVSYAAPAQVSYSAPAHQVTYAAPAHQVAYAAPAQVAYAAPAKVAYAAPVGHVSYSSPAYSYHH